MADQFDALPVAERETLKARRQRLKQEPTDPLVGLALSGGGIRSGSFSLGILKVLDKAGLVDLADYLSTVSGGGYIGAYLLANRMAGRKVDFDETVQDEEGDGRRAALGHLRKYGNYLTPAMGLFSVDTWSMAMVWLRNTLMLQTFLLVVFALILLVPRLSGAASFYWLSKGVPEWSIPVALMIFQGMVALICCLLIWGYDGVEHWSKHEDAWRHWLKGRKAKAGARMRWIRVGLFSVIVCALVGCTLFVVGGFRSFASDELFPGLAVRFGLTFFIAGFFLSLFSLGFGRGFRVYRFARLVRGLVAVAYVLASTALCVYGIPGGLGAMGWKLVQVAALLTVFAFLGMRFVFQPEEAEKWKDLSRALFAGFITSLAAAAGIAVAKIWLGDWAERALEGRAGSDLWNYSLFAAPGLMATNGLCIIVLIAITGRAMPDLVREAWSRLGALLGLVSVALLVVGVVGVYGPLWMMKFWLAANNYVIASGGVTTAALGLFSLLTANSAETDGKRKPSGLKEKLVGAAPAAFILLVLCSVALAVHLAMAYLNRSIAPDPASWPTVGELADFYWLYLKHSVTGDFLLFLGLAGALVLMLLVLGMRLDINECSINRFYRNRLARCFIGAARAGHRNEDQLTGFDGDDDVNVGQVAKFLQTSDTTPIPLINTALNAVGGADAGLSERRAESFSFTPFEASSKSTGAIPISGISTGRGAGDVTLGSLIAISGAAANPNMGFHTSPAVAFLLTFFNIRLGWWVGVPAKLKGTAGWFKRQFNLQYVFFELFGTADTDDAFVNLSDGGHFDNLGIYELVRRKCRLIVVADGEQDGKYTFEGLGNAIRRCRIDFGAQINIDVSPIRPKETGAVNGRQWAVGTVVYHDGEKGYLLYLKSAYTGREPFDVQQYRHQHAEFPHQTTGDQFFNESQLESYRQLGINAATELLTALEGAKSTRKQWVDAAAAVAPR